MEFTDPIHILHIGANDGKEVEEYLRLHSSTLKSITFVECLPNVYKRLCERLAAMKSATGTPVELIAIQALLSDEDDKQVTFHISSNWDQSSSMLQPNMKEWVWDWVKFDTTLELQTVTADTLIQRGILKEVYDAVALDTQGSELKVLKGMTQILPHVNQIITEFSKKEFYIGGVLLPELVHHLMDKGFQIEELPTSNHADMLFVRKRS